MVWSSANVTPRVLTVSVVAPPSEIASSSADSAHSGGSFAGTVTVVLYSTVSTPVP